MSAKDCLQFAKKIEKEIESIGEDILACDPEENIWELSHKYSEEMSDTLKSIVHRIRRKWDNETRGYSRPYPRWIILFFGDMLTTIDDARKQHDNAMSYMVREGAVENYLFTMEKILNDISEMFLTIYPIGEAQL
jgi:hypothetical protein